jgi:transposase
MFYLGIDLHKYQSYVTVLNDAGQEIFKGELYNKKINFEMLLKKLNGPCKGVIETTYNWEKMYDELSEIGIAMQVAHAFKLRVIAESQIKNDKRDSLMLAKLLKADMIPAIYIPSKAIRQVRNIIRERVFLVSKRTSFKNRVHVTLDRNDVSTQNYSDIFGKTGRKYMSLLELEGTEQDLLDYQLENIDHLNEVIKEVDKLIKTVTIGNRYVEILKSMVGFGEFFSRVVAVEVADIERFRSKENFASYCGLVPMEHSSSDSIHRGPVVKHANKYMKWAFVEAAWVAVRTDPYFRDTYYNIKLRRGANKAIVAVARKMCEVVYKMLKENRYYITRNKMVALGSG